MLYLFFRGDPSPRRAGRDQDFPTAIIAQNGSPDAPSAEPREATAFEIRAIWNSLSESMDWSKKFGSAEGFLYNFSFFPPCLSRPGSADERPFEAQPRPAQADHCECLRGRRGARRARGGGRGPARAGREDDRRMAWPARLDLAANQGDARRDQKGRRQSRRPHERAQEGRAHTRIRAQRVPLDQARISGGRRNLHPPRLLAAGPPEGRPGSLRKRLDRRLLLPLPRLALRPRRPRLPEQARTGQPQGSPLHLSLRHPDPHRRGQEGGLARWLQPKSKP